jgi:hypothetical protein
MDALKAASGTDKPGPKEDRPGAPSSKYGILSQAATKMMRKLIKTLKHKKFHKILCRMIATVLEIIWAKKSQARWYSSGFPWHQSTLSS